MRQCAVATLGRLDRIGGLLQDVINGLLIATGRVPVLGEMATPDAQFDLARALGSVWFEH